MASAILSKQFSFVPSNQPVLNVRWYLPDGMGQHTSSFTSTSATVTASDMVSGQFYSGIISVGTYYRNYESPFTFSSNGLVSDGNLEGRDMTSAAGDLAVTTP